jgi:hypothetical protein
MVNHKKKAITKARRDENTKGEEFTEEQTFFVLSVFRVFVGTSSDSILYAVFCLLYSTKNNNTLPFRALHVNTEMPKTLI